MKKLLFRRGVPFLLTLGFLFVISGGFLAFQIWGSPDLTGAAAALEAPELPPSLDGPPPEPPASPAPAPEEAGAEESAPEPAEEPAPEPKEEPVPVEAPAPAVLESAPEEPTQLAPSETPKPIKVVAPAKPSTPVVRPPTVKAEPGKSQGGKPALVVKKVPPAPAKPSEKKPETKIEAAAQPGNALPMPPRKARRARKPKQEPVPTVCPSEWNWFSAPLKAQLVDGRIQIVGGAEPVELAAVAAPVEPTERVPAASLVQDGLDGKPVSGSQIAWESVPSSEIPGEKPFAKALERMSRNRQKREVEAQKIQVVLPSSGGSVEGVPASLIKLQKTLAFLEAGLAALPVSDADAASSESAGGHKVINPDSLAPAASYGGAVSAEVVEFRAPQSAFSMGLSEILRQEAKRP